MGVLKLFTTGINFTSAGSTWIQDALTQ
jgi:hypothetical protein